MVIAILFILGNLCIGGVVSNFDPESPPEITTVSLVQVTDYGGQNKNHGTGLNNFILAMLDFLRLWLPHF